MASDAHRIKSTKALAGKALRPVENMQSHNPYWTSSLFNEVYLRNDIPKKYASIWDDDAGFEMFHQQFHNFVLETADEDFDSWSESDTINNWIVHIMQMLGWHDRCESARVSPYITELSLTIPEDGRKRTYRADLVYVDDPKFKQFITKATKAEDKLREARSAHTGALMVIEAKYWDRLEHSRQNRSEDKKRLDVEQDDGTRHLDPNDQTLKYMEILQRDFGILTDGKTWRLFHRYLSLGDTRRYFEFDLGNLADLVRGGLDNATNRDRFLNEARYFYHFFKKSAVVQKGHEIPFLFEILEYSKKYASTLEENLKERFIQAIGFACNSLKNSYTKSREKFDHDQVRNISESHLFNILFIRSCESRKILPINATAYYKRSLTEIIETLDYMNFDPDKGLDTYLRFLKTAFGDSFQLNGFEIYKRLLDLYRIVHEGDMGFEVSGFKESLFSKKEWQLAKTLKIDNGSMLMILFSLNFTESEFQTRKYQQIPYNFFTPRQLGSIYESFLEFKLEQADRYMIFTKMQWQEAAPGSEPARRLLAKGAPEVRKGELYFTPDNTERKATGSYYTPDYVVDYIIRTTLEPLCKRKKAKEILSIAVCDPAMGSGHFLSGALVFLTQMYRRAQAEESISDVSERFEASARKVLESCIYGVDINPRAVKLAKMSLWLSTALPGHKLERLDDQLKCGDSLGASKEALNWESEFVHIMRARKGFDAVVGNPPYIYSRNMDHKVRVALSEMYETAKYQPDTFTFFIEKSLKLISPAGTVGMIVPTSLLTNVNYARIREFLLRKAIIRRVVDLKSGVFKNASVDTAIVELSQMSAAKDYLIEMIERKNSLDEDLASLIANIVSRDTILRMPDYVLNTRASVSVASLVERLSKSKVYFGEYVSIKAGMKVRKCFVSSKKESPFHKKFLLGRDIKPLSISWSNRWVHYDRSLEQKFSNQAFRDEGIFLQSEKLLIRKVTNPERFFVAFDNNQYYCDQSLYATELIKPISIKYLAGVLSSRFVNYYFQNTFSDRKETFPQVKGIQIERIPLPENPTERDIKNVEELVEKIQNDDKREESFKKLDNLVYRLYGLRDDEVDEVEKYYLDLHGRKGLLEG